MTCQMLVLVPRGEQEKTKPLNRKWHPLMIIECPQCSQKIDAGEEPPSSFSCPTCNGSIQLQVKAEAIKPHAAVYASSGQGIKLTVLLGSIAGAIGLSLLAGWLIWGRMDHQSDGRPDQRGAGNGTPHAIELNVSDPKVVVDLRNSHGGKPSQGVQKDESAEKWADREWVIKNLNYIRYHAIDRNKIQVRGEDQLAYAVNSVTPYTGWATEERYGGIFAGKSLLRFQEGKMLLHAEFFKTDQLESWKTYHPTLRCPHGLHIKWYENGSKEAEHYYKDGMLDGKFVEYHSNGRKHNEGQYKDDKINGRWDTWYENGARQAVANYQNGLQTGLFEKWHPNGKIWFKGAYQNDRMVGEWVSWDENGDVTRKDSYDQNGKWLKSWPSESASPAFENKPPQGALRE